MGITTDDIAIVFPVRRHRRFGVEHVFAVAMLAVLATGLGLGIAALEGPAAQRRLQHTLGLDSLVSGRTAAAVNAIMAHDLPIDAALRTAGGVLRWRLFASGGPQVWVGRRNWLFLIDELRPWPDAGDAMRFRADLLRRAADGLRARGIDLLVAVVPDKARIMAGMVDGPVSAQAAARYAAFAALLRARGLATADLATPLAAAAQRFAPYYRTDTHWNQPGAAVAAAAVAAAVITPLDRSSRFRTVAAAAETDGPGDLLRLMSLERVPDGLAVKLRPPADREYVESTLPDGPPPPQGDLLDVGAAPAVVLIGSSFSRHANFAGRLQQALGAEVGNYAEAGGGFAGAARAYFTSATFRETPPRLVIWEVPERVLAQPLTADDRALDAALPLLAGPSSPHAQVSRS